jgi:hypothetical protein
VAARDRAKKRKLQAAGVEVSAASLYQDLRWIQSTSNIVERAFSGARLILTDYRKSMKPCNFEIMMLLKSNKSMWLKDDVVKIESTPFTEEEAAIEFVEDDDNDDVGDELL